jgi:hypothetical protein
MSITTIRILGRQIDLNADPGVSIRNVTADYHRAMKIPLRSGRLFERSCRRGARCHSDTRATCGVGRSRGGAASRVTFRFSDRMFP